MQFSKLPLTPTLPQGANLPVKPPGLDQKATWLRVKVAQPDWVILSTFGVMTPTALQEAAQVGFPRDKIVGISSICAEQDVVPSGEAAVGFICAELCSTHRHECSSTSMRLPEAVFPRAWAQKGLVSTLASAVCYVRTVCDSRSRLHYNTA